MPEYRPKLSFYKPNKTGSGAAAQFDYNPEKKAVFLEMARQTGEKAFDWEHKLALKLAMTDCTKLLTVLLGKAPKTELFHDPSKGDYATSQATKNSTLTLQKGTQYGYYLKLSLQGQDGKVESIPLNLSDDEAIILDAGLKLAVEGMIGWQ
jgi:hypothetical protein